MMPSWVGEGPAGAVVVGLGTLVVGLDVGVPGKAYAVVSQPEPAAVGFDVRVPELEISKNERAVGPDDLVAVVVFHSLV